MRLALNSKSRIITGHKSRPDIGEELGIKYTNILMYINQNKWWNIWMKTLSKLLYQYKTSCRDLEILIFVTGWDYVSAEMRLLMISFSIPQIIQEPWWNNIERGKHVKLEDKPISAPIRPPQIPLELTWQRIPDFAVNNWQLCVAITMQRTSAKNTEKF